MMIGLARPSGGSIEIDGIDAVKNVKKAQSIMGIVSMRAIFMTKWTASRISASVDHFME